MVTKFAKVVILVSIALIVFSFIGIYVAAVSELKNINVDVTIVEGTKAVNVWQDEALTLELTAIWFGQFQRGTSYTQELYIENTELEPININLITSGDLTGWMDVTFVPETPTALAQGEVAHYTAIFSVPLDAEAGHKTFSIKVMEQ